MRKVRYQVAMSLDGYIAGPDGGADWIVMDPEIDFAALFAQFDTFLMGRVTWEAMQSMGPGPGAGTKTIVFSRTLRQEDHPGLTIVSGGAEEVVAGLKAEEGKDVWLFGGGQLFRDFLERGLVDTVEVAVIPVLLGGGIPLLPAPARQASLRLTGHRLYAKTGIMLLEYDVVPPARRKSRKRAA